MQRLDYPLVQSGIPLQASQLLTGRFSSWYLYGPRMKCPYVRGALLDLWTKARAEHEDPVVSWKSLVENPEARARWQRARGKGGFRRVAWDAIVELIAAANIYTIKKWGTDRIAGFSPIPAMSMISYASGARILQLIGGVALRFYDWYGDLPTSFPEVWGDQTDVCESADWYNSMFIVSMASNLNMTRTPDVHFISEARTNGAKFVVLAPDFSQISKYCDEWIPIEAGQDGALWMAVNHVILKEFYVDRQVPYFLDYLKRYTDCPFPSSNWSAMGRVIARGSCCAPIAWRATKTSKTATGRCWYSTPKAPSRACPKGTVGFRWPQKEKGKWNLSQEDGLDNSPIDAVLSFIDQSDAVVQVEFDDFANGVPEAATPTVGAAACRCGASPPRTARYW